MSDDNDVYYDEDGLPIFGDPVDDSSNGAPTEHVLVSADDTAMAPVPPSHPQLRAAEPTQPPPGGRPGPPPGGQQWPDAEWSEWNPAEEYYDADWARLPRRTSWWFKALIFFVILGGSLGTAAYVVNNWVQDQLDPPGDPGDELVIDIPIGAAVSDVARILQEEGVVANTWVFRQYLGWKDFEGVQAGEYTFQEDMAVWEAKDVLLAGPAPIDTFSITIPEGLWLSETQVRLVQENPQYNAEEMAAAVNSGAIRSQFQPAEVTSLEGLMFPDTYQLNDDSAADEAAIVQRMVSQFDTVATELGYADAQTATGLSAYEVIIVASLVEAEARVEEDRGKIARVVYNRLEQDIPIGIDATLLFAAGERRPGGPTQADIDAPGPYNSRQNIGLPPTPISAPGRASLEAALNPAEGPWIFFVLADEDGRHFFTDSAQEFDEQVQLSREQGLL